MRQFYHRKEFKEAYALRQTDQREKAIEILLQHYYSEHKKTKQRLQITYHLLMRF